METSPNVGGFDIYGLTVLSLYRIRLSHILMKSSHDYLLLTHFSREKKICLEIGGVNASKVRCHEVLF